MRKLFVPLTVVLSVATAPMVVAEEAENYIKYRQAVMKAIGGHTGASSQIVRGKIEAGEDLAMHAAALARLNSDLTRLFPEGSDFGETKAKGEIWEDWDKFEQAAKAAQDATAAFAAAAESGDQAAIAASFKDVGDSCKGCHKDFRQKDD
jgi:cytochrome c556